MARFVFENFPVCKLPDDLREGFDPDGYVTVTIETTEQAEEGEAPTALPEAQS